MRTPYNFVRVENRLRASAFDDLPLDLRDARLDGRTLVFFFFLFFLCCSLAALYAAYISVPSRNPRRVDCQLPSVQPTRLGSVSVSSSPRPTTPRTAPCVESLEILHTVSLSLSLRGL